ncbi:MAG: CU044_5270 family protein [Nocardioidaceae bacterium]
MSRDDTLTRQVARIDPCRSPTRLSPADAEHAGTTLSYILAQPQQSPRGGAQERAATPVASGARRRGIVTLRWGLSAAVVVALVAVVVVATGVGGVPLLGAPSRASAATPALLHYQGTSKTAEQVLTEAAEATAKRPAPPPGRYAYMKTEGWGLTTSVDGPSHSSSMVVPRVSEIWRADNGSGHGIDYQGKAVPPGTTPDPGAITGDGTVHNYGPGGMRGDWKLSELSADPVKLRHQLLAGDPSGNNPAIPDGAELWVAVTQLLDTHQPSPKLQAALWRVLARLPHAHALGPVVDRAGRHGVGVAYSSDYGGLPTSYRLIIDPNTGRLLGDSEVLTKDAGKLNVPIPSVITYGAILAAGHVDQIGARPQPNGG